MKGYKTQNLFIALIATLFLSSCELIEKDDDDIAPTISVIQPKEGETYYNTGKGFNLIMKLSDPEKNGNILEVSGNGQLEFNINQEDFFYDEIPDTIGNISPILYGDPFSGKTYIGMTIQDEGGGHSLGDINFYYKLDEAILNNITLEKFGEQGTDGSWPVKAIFDIQMASGDLGTVIELIISNQDFGDNFSVPQNYAGIPHTYGFGFDCNVCGQSSPPNLLTSHFEADVSGNQNDELFLYVGVINYSNGGGIFYRKYNLGVVH